VTEIDVALAERSRRGDREAFEELVRRTARGVFAHLYLETGDAHRAEDLSQETYLRAWRSIGSLAEAGGFHAWLYSIAHSVLLSDVRRGSRLKRGENRQEQAAAAGLASGAATPQETAERREERMRVLAVLRSMPAEYRLPLTLRYISGADYETIGRELAISNGSLRGLLHRGLAMMRKQLAQSKR